MLELDAHNFTISTDIPHGTRAHTPAFVEVHSGWNPLSEIFLLACSGGRDIPKWMRAIGFTVFVSVYPSLVSSHIRIHFDVITIRFSTGFYCFLCAVLLHLSRGLYARSV